MTTQKRKLLGMLTPSSNTALEPITSAMVADLDHVSVHFSRFRVTQISLGENALGQFDLEKILDAARLLADAEVDVIAWNGTSAGWLGFETDEALCRQITETTGIPATTSVLALNEILARTGVTELGLVTPYLEDVQQRIVANYARQGIRCTAERHLGLSKNFEFSEVSAQTLEALVNEVAQARPQAITTFCTNLHAAPLARALEAKTGIPVYDTISTVLWKSLRLAGVDTRALSDWGQLFQQGE
ncbi:aspartate/glutamate racemase family protein [Pandoraea sp. XJJ-1]|uniref:Arylmalonate decarboxylase n=1 Tax=Pandoraea cepalis TaxID=2508294 RepID=A0A5E4WXZ7_9BURK|nr:MULTISPECIES: aspartate/glutamate racemase family protein [Pandoraea]WAL84251.1 aspartate/glutamate racemase family protein [Pandoraea sp. XJJ-1]BDD95000.1 Asp/Glu/hydantoin racemase [Pandoraea sp. NE5]VVE28809.1 Arylmalonate decarboxylase [Pandoraea cepalis]